MCVAALHLKFINLKGTKAVTYESYLSLFNDFSNVPKEVSGWMNVCIFVYAYVSQCVCVCVCV